MKRNYIVLAGILVLGLLTGCSAESQPPPDLSTSQPSLLFFYTEN